ncbi:Exo-beta-D-glucosaminidase [Tolypocladium paradoxum]|uniref:Exo-beta-D-glucosaminidase n=1 Tax=Tolypocladium paradoxum TaxID=94208 RepID=A0A2S4LBF3_9HYPO|nr:Exo-beta-D-glucosaminidase [Tolypocladium paradoxum]
MLGHVLAVLVLGSGSVSAASSLDERAAQTIMSGPGQRAVIPSWDLQPSSSAKGNLASVSRPGHDTSSWHHIKSSRCTLMGCLLDTGVYKDSDLWYSDNLDRFNWGQFLEPWVYRNEFSLAPKQGQHFFLETNGISSRADLYLNGRQVADKEFQAGSFGGRTYDITGLVADTNALAVRAYPADFNYNLVQGFVDWNPRAPDNGSGIWRDIVVKQTGPVSMGAVSVSIDMDMPAGKGPAKVTVRAKAQNLEGHEVQLVVRSVVADPSGCKKISKDQVVKLGPEETKVVEIAHTVDKPKIWWPKAWGKQPLYESELTFTVDSKLSDASQDKFGIRTVTSHVNSHNDTMFTVNGHPFQVLGAGYSPDQFFRWDRNRFATIARYALDMGLNTIRLEGMMEHPELYEMADEMGIMLIAGWVCCSKWESWDYNHDLQVDPVPLWVDNDYETANASMAHEAAMLQTHPSMLAYFIGSDFWPNDRATRIYVDALRGAYWQVPIIASASKRGFPELLGPGGMKMDGPYDWVPPNYWYDTEPSQDRRGAAFGFGSELGAGVGTPEMGSLRKFLSESDMEDLWRQPNKDLFHMSTNTSSFYNRKTYNEGLFRRYGAPTSLDDYLLKAQMMDYEATRAQHEGYSSRWNAERPATGTIYWMLNNAWPSLHWNQFDHYMHPAGSYFGSKVGSRVEHVAYDYVRQSACIINHSLGRQGAWTIAVELVDLGGEVLSKQTLAVTTEANTAASAGKVAGLGKIRNVAFLRLVLSDKGATLSRNVYWLAKAVDALDWKNSTWYHTPVTTFADFSALGDMETATVSLKPAATSASGGQALELENRSPVPAFFVRLNLVDEHGEDVNPAFWSDNYVTLWPHERLQLQVSSPGGGKKVQISGGNVEASEVAL